MHFFINSYSYGHIVGDIIKELALHLLVILILQWYLKFDFDTTKLMLSNLV